MNNKTDLRTPDFFGDSTELILRLNCEDQFTYYLGLLCLLTSLEVPRV